MRYQGWCKRYLRLTEVSLEDTASSHGGSDPRVVPGGGYEAEKVTAYSILKYRSTPALSLLAKGR